MNDSSEQYTEYMRTWLKYEAESEKRMMKEKLGKVDELSPFILKKRIDRIKNRIAKLERQRAAVREGDQRTRSEAERNREQQLSKARDRLEEVRVEMRNIKNNSANYQDRLSFWNALSGQQATRELSKDVASRLLKLEDEEYRLEVGLGLEPSPQSIDRLAASRGVSSGNLKAGVWDPAVLPEVKTEKYFRYMKRTDEYQKYFNPVLLIGLGWRSHEAELEKSLQPLLTELSILQEGLGPQEERLGELEAFKARVLKESRKLASRVRMSCAPTDNCPYCETAIGKDARLDHIYPVSKGGLSVRSNLVFVCIECNQRKSDMTLAAFLKVYKLDRVAIEARLTKLGKEF